MLDGVLLGDESPHCLVHLLSQEGAVLDAGGQSRYMYIIDIFYLFSI
jgi:hypothetical protein